MRGCRGRFHGTGCCVAALGLLWAAAWGSRAVAAPITFNTALPVATQQFVFRERFVRVHSTGDVTPANRDLTASGAISVLAYGVTPDFALFGIAPWFDKRLELNMGGGRIARSTGGGLGDVTLLGRYTAYRYDGPGVNLRVAPYAGVQAPTGSDDVRDALGLLPRPLQPGSGAWDPIVGLVATYQTLPYEVDGQFSYKATTAAGGFRFGNSAELDGSLQYRLWPRRLGSGLPAFVYGVMEFNLVHQDRNEINGVADPNSGGTTLSLAPGLQYVTRTWILEAAVQVPVAQNLNGSGLMNDYVVNAGFRINF
ncbi:MAG: hypothetical protein B7Z66_00145 [Chromatiales bacterium 21-64-14]|nr:MAG: hypothetical protein B7Z66_00145 [Chromatiales bacterium 21-64-14]HQU16269.1 transporter [Gammaproteobacteria bacterium]